MSDPSDQHLDSRTWPELEHQLDKQVTPILLVPLGSTEQHGPHLPIGTDTFIAEAWCKGLASQGVGVLVAPALPYGSAGEHQNFPGTLSIGAEALHLVLIELARSAAHSFARVVFVSGHAGNLGPLRRAVRQLRDEGHDVAGLVPVLKGSDAHAGRTETSLMLAINEDSVRLGSAEPGNSEPIADLLERLQSAGTRSVSPNGVLGDPAGASQAEGRALLNVLVSISVYDGGHC